MVIWLTLPREYTTSDRTNVTAIANNLGAHGQLNTEGRWAARASRNI